MEVRECNFSAESPFYVFPRLLTLDFSTVQKQGFTQALPIELLIVPAVTGGLEPLKVNRNRQLRINDSCLLSEQSTYRGLVNEGQTCYMNTLFQSLFSIGAFRNAVLQCNPKEKSEALHALKRIFYQLQKPSTDGKMEPVRTH